MASINKNFPDTCKTCPARSQTAFRDLSPDLCESIDKLRSLREFAQNEPIRFSENEKQGFYCLRQGHLRLGPEAHSSKGVVRICGPGDLVGYESSNPDRQAIALENMKMCFFVKEDFVKLQRNHFALAEAVIQALIRVIQIKDERIVGLENHNVMNRVASTLTSLTKKFGVKTERGIDIDVKLDRKTLAQLSGTVIESLARTLTKLEEDNIILRQGRKLFVIDQKKLKHLADK